MPLEVSVKDEYEDNKLRCEEVKHCHTREVNVHGTTDIETMCFMRSKALCEREVVMKEMRQYSQTQHVSREHQKRNKRR